jgi:hypothetical protein
MALPIATTLRLSELGSAAIYDLLFLLPETLLLSSRIPYPKFGIW